jgi:hypothetical protein
MAPPSLCGGSVSSRRGLVASLWSVVVCLTTISFIVALIFTLYHADEAQQSNENAEAEDNREPELAVTSRAMAFAAMWTAVLASLLAIFGAVVLGWQSPTGVYYTCCSPQVHRTTPLALGSFIGALLMFANMTLVCSILFGEFDVSLRRLSRGYSHVERSRLMLIRFAITEKVKTKKLEKILQCGDLQWRFRSCACF